MTPRPSDEAREALRAARERAAREPAAGTAGPPTGRPHRPGDAAREAREALRRARREARPADDTPAEARPGEEAAAEVSGGTRHSALSPVARAVGAADEPAYSAPSGGVEASARTRAEAGAAGGASGGTGAAEAADDSGTDGVGGRSAPSTRRAASRGTPPEPSPADPPAEATEQAEATETSRPHAPAPPGPGKNTPSAGSGTWADAGEKEGSRQVREPGGVAADEGTSGSRGTAFAGCDPLTDAGEEGAVRPVRGPDGTTTVAATPVLADADLAGSDRRAVGPVDARSAGSGPSAGGGEEGGSRQARRLGGVAAEEAGSGSGCTASAGSGPLAGAGGEGAGSPVRRPGDVAREALRSARAEAERARAQGEDRGGPERRRAVSPASRVSRTTRGDRVADARAREVRAVLADAFRMPTDEDAPRPEPVSEARTHREEPAAAPAPPTAMGPVPPETPPAPHAVPRSMAAPARDSDLRRTFPAFPPGTADGEGFAGTWWGRAWVTALEDGALDAARLARGRGYAEQGHVDAITVTPGLVLAYVRGSRPRPYRVQVRLRTFGDADWERFLDAAAERPGHIAALLDNEMPQSLADCGVSLLPGPGDLAPHCSCPDSGHPCKHAAALCYQTARLLDADPFVLLLLRGRGEREVIDALSRRSAASAARAALEREPEPLPGVRATEALARRELPALPAPLPLPPHPEQPPVYPASPGGPDPLALDQLATDAAARAHALLTTGRDPVGGITLWHDTVRLAAARPGSGLTAATRTLYSSLARAAGRTPAELARAVAAWRQGGAMGLAVLEDPWDPPAGRFDRARPLLLAADLPAFRPWRNRLTHPRGHVQLRLGRDHLWYAYESEAGHDDWWPRGTPDVDPVGALTALDTPGEP